MKLISLYIEQFGGLSQYRLDFEDGLTVIQEENGFGKTTLAEFIRAMFYGFPRKTKQLGKRQKYLPWAGGKCAGNLEFEQDGIRYRLERTFGATPKSDTFRLIETETNRPSARFTENIGIELFGLDSDSFERSTYLPQNALTERLTTDSIRAKLSDLVEDTGDVGNFEKASAALKTKRSSYALYRGVGGSVAEAGSQITRLQMELSRGETAKQQQIAAQESITRLEGEKQQAAQALAQVRAQITQASEAAAVAAAQKQHRHLTEQLRLAQAQQAAQSARFPQGVPTREELDAQRANCNEYLTCTAQAKGLGLTGEEQAELAQLRPAYLAGELEESRLNGLTETLRRLDCLGEVQEDLPLPAPAEKASPAVPIGAMALGVAALVAGIVLLVQGNYLLGGTATALGVLGLLLGAFFGIKGMISRELGQTALRQQMEEKKAKQATEAAALDRELAAALGSGADYSRAIMERHLQRERYLDLEAEAKRTGAEKEALLTRAKALRQETDTFLGRYFASPVEPEQYHRCLDALAREGDAWLRGEGQLAQAVKALEAFRAEHSRELAQPEVTEVQDLKILREAEWELNQRLDGLAGELLAQRQRCNDLREQADRVPEIEDQLASWQEKKQQDQKMVTLLDDTLAFLQEAKDSLSASYLGPIRRGFDRYLAQLSDAEEGRVLIDPDLNLQLERQGQARELGYFSAGQADLVMLCMRLALVDALFTEEKPFVILDDPFVNLDDKRTAAALALLQALSRERQILYLVCNTSRAVAPA